MEYIFEAREIEPIRVAYMQYSGKVEGCNKLFPTVFKSIGGKFSAAPFLSYYDFNVQDQTCKADVCVPTEEMPKESCVNIKELPYTKALCTTHVGSYELLYQAYEQLRLYAQRNDMKLKLPYREVYIKGPGMFIKGNPAKYVTEIIFPTQ